MTLFDDLRPIHLAVTVDDKRTICGIKLNTKAALPHMLARFVDRHRAGHARNNRLFILCAECDKGRPQCEISQ